MSEVSEKTKPTIDHQYWFDFSKKLTENAIPLRESAAEGMQKLVIWLWGIYTAVAAVGFALSGKQLEFWPTLIIAIPSGLLIIVYWGAVWVQMPKRVNFDYRDPEDIQKAYSVIVETKDRRLAITTFMSVAAAIMVSVGLVVASVSKIPNFSVPTFQASLEPENNGTTVSVTAHVGKAKSVLLRLIPLVDSAPVDADTLLTTLLPTPEGLIQTSAHLKVVSNTVRVELTWDTDNNTRMQLSRICTKLSTQSTN